MVLSEERLNSLAYAMNTTARQMARELLDARREIERLRAIPDEVREVFDSELDEAGYALDEVKRRMEEI